MKAIVYVALGGALGAILRYLAGLAFKPEFHAAFPIHTFLVNTVGCLLIGLAFSYLTIEGQHGGIQWFIITGVLGGFTTFSSYTMEAVYLVQQGEFIRSIAYVLVSNTTGIGAAAFGYQLMRWII